MLGKEFGVELAVRMQNTEQMKKNHLLPSEKKLCRKENVVIIPYLA